MQHKVRLLPLIALVPLLLVLFLLAEIIPSLASPLQDIPATMTAVSSELLGEPWTDDRGFICWETQSGHICYQPQYACSLFPWVCPATPEPAPYPGVAQEVGNANSGAEYQLFSAVEQEPLPTAKATRVVVTRGNRGK